MTQNARRSTAVRVAAAAAVGAMVVTGAIGAAAASSGTWGTARKMPGTAALDQGLPAEALSVSCASPGNCAAGGSYSEHCGKARPRVDSGVHGSLQEPTQ